MPMGIKYKEQIISCLSKFYKFSQKEMFEEFITQVDVKMVYEYLQYLIKRSPDNKIINATTINDYFGNLKRVWNALYDAKLVIMNPFDAWKPLKVSKSLLNKIIPVSVVKNIIVELRDCSKLTFSEYRNKVLFLLLITNGIRISEALSLKWTDIKRINNVLCFRVIGKGNKEIVRPLPDKLFMIIQQFRTLYAESEYLFYTFYAGNYQTLSARIIQRWFKANIGFEYTPHCCRHTAITNYYEITNDIVKTANLAGHSNIQTTQRYIHEADRIKSDVPSKSFDNYEGD